MGEGASRDGCLPRARARSAGRVSLGIGLLVAGLTGFAAMAPAAGVASAAPATPAVSKSAAAKPSLATGAAAVVAKPDAASPGFAGRWRLDVARSAHGKSRRVPLSRKDLVTLEGPWLGVKSLSVREGNDTLWLEYRYRTDGEAMNTVMGQEVKTRGRRDGATQHFDSEARFLFVSLFVNEHWTLSADGRTLTVVRESKSPLGDDRQRLVFVRQ